MQHSKLSPSSSHRWLTCSASPKFIDSLNLPPEPSSSYANEGTEAHTVFAEALGLRRPLTVKYQTPEQKEFLPAMIEHVMTVCALYPKAKLYREHRVNPERFVDSSHCAGTADIIIPVRNGPMYVMDLKFGEHVAVDVIDNSQLILYALGAWAEFYNYNPTEFVITILQPRAYHPDGPIRELRLSPRELRRWARRIRRGVKEVLGPSPVFRPDPEEQCRWCPAAGVCATLAAYGLKQARTVFTEVIDHEAEYKDINALTRGEVSHLLKIFPGLRRWMSSVSEFAVKFMENGGRLPYWELKEKMGNRAWSVDEDELELYFSEEVLYEQKLRTPPQVEKLAGKHSVDAFVKREVTGYTIVETDDPSEADETLPFDAIEDPRDG